MSTNVTTVTHFFANKALQKDFFLLLSMLHANQSIHRGQEEKEQGNGFPEQWTESGIKLQERGFHSNHYTSPYISESELKNVQPQGSVFQLLTC